MTKKDYERLARAFARSRPADDSAAYYAWIAVRNAVADELGNENERFRRGTFLVATDASFDGR